MTTIAAEAAAPASDDLALVQRYAASGSAEAFAAVVAQHADFVFATALRQTRGDRDLAEDVTQATFIVLARRAGSFRQGTSVAGFLHQTAIYAAKNALRAAARRRKHEANVAIHPMTAAAATSHQHAVESVNDAAAVAVDHALMRLRDRDRRLLMLHYFDGLTVAEAAARLAITHEAARKRLHRALERLRELLAHAGTPTTAGAIPATLATMAHPAVQAHGTASLVSQAIAGSAAGAAGAAGTGGAGGSAVTLAREAIRAIQLLALKKSAAVAVIAIAASAAVVGGVVGVRAMVTTPTSARQVVVTPADARGPMRTMATVPAAGNAAGAATRPAGTDIIDYDKVFTSCRRVMDERAKLEKARKQVETELAARKRQIGALRHEVETAGPARKPRFEEELRQAIAEDAKISKEQQAAFQRDQARTMLDIFVQLESAIQTVARSQNVTLPADAFAPYPANVDRLTVDQLRAAINKRRVARPPGAPDLSDAVLALLDERYAALQAAIAATRPSAAR